MRYLPSNTLVKIDVDIKVDGEFTYPNSDVRVTIVSGYGKQVTTIPASQTSNIEVSVQTPMVDIGALEYQTLMVECSTPIGYFRDIQNLISFDYSDLFVDIKEVRNLLGLKEFELNQNDIDLEGMYLKTLKTFKPEFNDARQFNPYLTKQLGDLIAIKEAIRVAPTLAVKLSKKEDTENGAFTRWGDPKDLERLLASLEKQYYDLLDDLVDYVIVQPLDLSLFAPTLIPMKNQSTGGVS